MGIYHTNLGRCLSILIGEIVLLMDKTSCNSMVTFSQLSKGVIDFQQFSNHFVYYTDFSKISEIGVKK